jgi:hypothetical protein
MCRLVRSIGSSDRPLLPPFPADELAFGSLIPFRRAGRLQGCVVP